MDCQMEGPATDHTANGVPVDVDTQITHLADDMLSAHSVWGEAIKARGGWDHETPTQRAVRHQQEDNWLRVLKSLDGMVVVGTPAWVTHGMLRQELESATRARIGQFHIWDVNQLTGWHLRLGLLAASVAVSTPLQRETALSRFGALPSLIRSRIDDLNDGLSRGYAAAVRPVRRVVQQISALLEDETLESAAARAADDMFARAWTDLMTHQVRPALREFRAFLAGSYTESARDDGALIALPNGLEIYRSELFRFTSLDLTPDELLEGAEDQLAAIDAKLEPIFARLYPGATLAEAKRAMREDPRHARASRADAIEHVRAAMDRVKPQLSRFFRHVPGVPLVVEPMTSAEERTGMSAYYQSPEGGNFARLVLNTSLLGRWETLCMAVHEGYPGHHFERVYGDECSRRHAATVELQTHAFREGWAVYSEWLANEMDVYTNDDERAGQLLREAGIWVARILDVSLHTGRISRDGAVEMLVMRGGRTPDGAEALADKHIALPGHAVSYTVGVSDVQALRHAAEERLGSRFDMREFHDVLLRDGPITLPMQRAKAIKWMEENRQGVG